MLLPGMMGLRDKGSEKNKCYKTCNPLHNENIFHTHTFCDQVGHSYKAVKHFLTPWKHDFPYG
jgi:hypothetical protein